jgi:phosphonatase-like hydrolase
MSKIKLVVFDLSGTTVSDDNAVAKCLFNAAQQFGLSSTLSDFEKTIGTNKIHLYEFMIARDSGIPVEIENLESYRFPEYHERALEIFDHYSVLMIDFYRNNIQAMDGAEEVFLWCKENGIKVATDTGFHRDVNMAIMEGLQWRERGLIDIALDVENTDGIGRPAPYLIHQAMYELGVQSVHEVIKIGDTPADLLSGYNAGCKGNIGVLSGANSRDTLIKYPHTHIIDSVKQLPDLIMKEFN